MGVFPGITNGTNGEFLLCTVRRVSNSLLSPGSSEWWRGWITRDRH